MSALEESHTALAPSSLLAFLPQSAFSSPLNVSLYTPTTIPAPIFTSCFNLVRDNMKAMYQRSSMGWNDQQKRDEMADPAIRFLVLDEDREVKGFVSFMITNQHGSDVIYCYELQLAKDEQRKGYGEKLMEMMEAFGRNVGVHKAMLTVFPENEGARRFYSRRGYELDEESPKDKKLRGRIVVPSYYELKKAI